MASGIDPKDAQTAEQPSQNNGDTITIDSIVDSGAVAIGRNARATINQYTEIIVKVDNFEDLPPVPGEPPYKGLAYFSEEDKDIYFGRENLSDQLAERLRKARFLALIGASGSGKSSLLRAGIIPRLRMRNWQIHVINPGAHPLTALAGSISQDDPTLTTVKELRQALLVDPETLYLAAGKVAARHDAERLLLAVDQFEEIFTQCKDAEERQAFVENLIHAAKAGGATTVLLSMRADFYDRISEFAELTDHVSKQQEYIKPMAQENLVRIIAEPARLAGWQFVEGLVEQIVEDVGQEPGRLPLLSHAILETWNRRRGVVMTLGGYRDAGGVEGAIAKTAEDTLKRLIKENPQFEDVTRAIFLDLTELGEGAEDTRRIASRDALSMGVDKDDFNAVLEELVAARLITMDKAEVEVAHEALIRRWPTLRTWLEENRVRLRFERQLQRDVLVWEKLDRDAGALYRGAPLAQAQQWQQENSSAVNALTREFLAESVQNQRRERLRQYAGFGFAALLIVIALIAYSLITAANNTELAAEITRVFEAEQTADGNLVLSQRNEATAVAAEATSTFNEGQAKSQAAIATRNLAAAVAAQGTAEAESTRAFEQAQLAEARALAVQAETAIERNDPREAYLRAIQAIDSYENNGSPASEADVALARALAILPDRATMVGHTDFVWSAVFNHDGSRILTASDDGTARLWDGEGVFIKALEGHTGEVYSAIFNYDGSRILTSSRDGTAKLWTGVGDIIATLEGGSAVFNHDGSSILTAGSGTARLWSGEGDFITMFDAHAEWISAAVFNHDGSSIVTAGCEEKEIDTSCAAGTVKLWDRDGNFIMTFGEGTGPIYEAVFNNSGSRILTTSAGPASIWDKEGNFIAELEGHQGALESAIFSPVGSRILTTSRDQTAKLWNGLTGNLIATLEGHKGWVNAAAFNHDGSRIVTASDDGTARVWDGEGNFIMILKGHTSAVESVAFNHDSTRIVTTSLDNTARLWDGDGPFISELKGHTGRVNTAVFNHDDSRIVTASGDQTAILWDGEGNFIKALEGHKGEVESAVFNHDGSRILTTSQDNKARLWDGKGNFIRTLEGHEFWLTWGIFNHDDSRIVTTSLDDTARLWDGEGGFIATLEGHSSDVTKAFFNRDDSRILTISNGDHPRLWDGRQGTFIATLGGDNFWATSTALTDDGDRIIANGCEGDLMDRVNRRCTEATRVWDTNGILLTALEGHTCDFCTAVYNHDSNRKLTTDNPSVMLLNVTTDNPSVMLLNGQDAFIIELGKHTGRGSEPVFNHDGSRVLTINFDSARLWEVYSSVEAMRDEALRRLQFWITEEECREYFDPADCEKWGRRQ